MGAYGSQAFERSTNGWALLASTARGTSLGRRATEGARSAGEQQDLGGRMRLRWSPGAMEDADDVVGVVDNLEDPHAAAALATDGDVECEDPGEELGPADAAGSRRDRGCVVVVVGAGEAEGELLFGRRDDGGRDDARA